MHLPTPQCASWGFSLTHKKYHHWVYWVCPMGNMKKHIHFTVYPRHSMYGIYIYMSTLTPQPPQLIGIYGSPMECLGYTVYRSYVFEEKYMCQRPYCITHSSGLTVEVAQARFLKDEGLGQSGHSESTHRKNTQVKTLWPQNLGEVHEQGGHQAVLQHQVRCQEP